METVQLDELKRLGSRLDDAAFVCGGSINPAQHGLTVWYKNPQGSIGEIAFPSQDPSDPEKLVNACVPATFGRGDQDVLDPTYRQAVRLDPGQFTTSFNLAEFSILPEVQAVIGGDIAGVRATLHKLNVYATGGFFKTHRDTPRTSNCIGTIVVCLPTQFSGGEMVVKNADSSFAHTFDWGPSASAGKVEWCAFYSDCEHEVLPVQSGHRVTLTYVLEHVELRHPISADTHAFTALSERLTAYLKDPSFAPDGTKLGFGLRHQYIVSKVGRHNTTVPLLKGADRVLKKTIDRLGLQYVFVPVYAGDDYNASPSQAARNVRYRYGSDGQDENYGSTCSGNSVLEPTEWKFPFHTDGSPRGKWRGDGETELFISDWRSYIDPANDLDYGPHGAKGLDFHQLNLHKTHEIVWVVRPTNFPYLKTSITYGNEHCLGHYYAGACFVVYIPPAQARGVKKRRTEAA